MLLPMRSETVKVQAFGFMSVPLLDRGIDVRHVFRDELVLASELDHSIVEDRDYKATIWRRPKAVA